MRVSNCRINICRRQMTGNEGQKSGSRFTMPGHVLMLMGCRMEADSTLKICDGPVADLQRTAGTVNRYKSAADSHLFFIEMRQ